MGSATMTTIIMIIMISPSSPSPEFLTHKCSNTTTYDTNSSFPINLSTLLSYLSTNASTSPAGFYSTSVGRATNDTVYGFFMCRGDLTTSACSDCVTTAVKNHKVTSNCPRSKEHVIFYEECMLRYDDRTLVGRLDQDPLLITINTQNISRNETGFLDLVQNTMNTLSTQAASSSNGKKYATAAKDFPSTFQKLYALQQCVPDLTVNDCHQCLKKANQNLWFRQGARVSSASCHMRYEIYAFFNGAYDLLSPPPLSSTPPPMVNISPSSTTQTKDGIKVSIEVIIAIVAPIATILVALLMLGICLIKRKTKKLDIMVVDNNAGDDPGEDISLIESIQYDLDTLQSATLSFSEENKLGEGGFGAVYKGTLSNGQEIAVKKLSKSSTQGLREFKNEALLVAKLQHRNLVKLLGFCVAGEEKLLVYEFVANKSLDHFLFDPEKQGLLDWETRHKIIQGIARGMLYLHQDSRLTVIHRDLKTSNVLLDTNLNPKISDFGLARIFRIDQTQGDTSRIVGTYGYMSPEYAMQGHFSTKSDVYSFGVIVLEIISGKKNSSFYKTDKGEDLLSYAWNLWEEGSLMDLVDPIIRNSCSSHGVLRCVHLGLLCVQECLSERPTMAAIVLMLDSVSITLPEPQQPSFIRSKTNFSKESGSDKSSSKSAPWSVNDVSITEPEPR